MLRVRDRYRSNPCAIWDPAAGAHVVPDPTRAYAEDDPAVLVAPWYFIAEGVQESPEVAPESVRIADIERATANPGEKRMMRRPR